MCIRDRYSLGVLCYNDGANILKKAAPLANSDADKYAAEKEKKGYPARKG